MSTLRKYKKHKWSKKIHVKSSMKNETGYAMFLGRFQPLHQGHMELFNNVLNEGKNVCIMVRDIEVSESNPYTTEEVIKNIEEVYKNHLFDGSVMVIPVPNITSINFGRGVGYDIIEHVPPTVIGEISATKIRRELKNKS